MMHPALLNNRPLLVDDHLRGRGRRRRRPRHRARVNGRGPALSRPGACVHDGHALIGPAGMLVVTGRPMVSHISGDGLDKVRTRTMSRRGRSSTEGGGFPSGISYPLNLGRLIARVARHVDERLGGRSSGCVSSAFAAECAE